MSLVLHLSGSTPPLAKRNIIGTTPKPAISTDLNLTIANQLVSRTARGRSTKRRKEPWRSTRPAHVKSGLRRGWSCSRRRRSLCGAATSWRGGGRSCRGFGSTRSTDSRPTRGRVAHRSLQRTLAAPRLPLHVRLRIPAHRRAPGMHRMLLDRRSLRRCHPPLERPRHYPRLRVDRPVAGAPGLQAANGLAIPVGFVARERLQIRLRRCLHRGAAEKRRRLQLSSTSTRPSRRRRV